MYVETRKKLTRILVEALKNEKNQGHKGDVYEEKIEEDGSSSMENVVGKFMLIYGMDKISKTITFCISRSGNDYWITCFSSPDYQVHFSYNPTNHSWSGISAIGSIGEDDYISLHDLISDLITPVRRLLI